MRELWRASDPEAGSVDWRAGSTGLIVPLWWAGVLGTATLVALGYRAAAVGRPRVHDLIGQDVFLSVFLQMLQEIGRDISHQRISTREFQNTKLSPS